MRAPGINTWADTWNDFRRSFTDFVAIPAVTVVSFLFLALGTYLLDSNPLEGLEALREFLKEHFLAREGGTDTLLSTLAGGMMTLTSITFSLMLLAVQQAAGSLTTQVLDQFLRRRLNQFYFGFFVGVTVYVLVTLATNNTRVTPVFGLVVALTMTILSLIMLVFLLYTTLNQMRSNRVIEAIHDLTLQAREEQQRFLGRTRRESMYHDAPVTESVRVDNNGYMARIDLDRIDKAAREVTGAVEVVMIATLGTYVFYHDIVAEVKASSRDDAKKVARAVVRALGLERQRNLWDDPGYGVTQLATIGWTSTSTAKSNPFPALASLRSLHDLIARWTQEETPEPTGAPVPVVYRDDILEGVIDALEHIAVAASESMQHRAITEIVMTFARRYDRLPLALRPRAEDAISRLLSSLGDHVLTADLDRALARLAEVLDSAHRVELADAVESARAALATSIGALNSKGTRVPDG